LSRVIPNVKAVHVPTSGCAAFTAFVSIKQTRPGEAKHAIPVVFGPPITIVVKGVCAFIDGAIAVIVDTILQFGKAGTHREIGVAAVSGRNGIAVQIAVGESRCLVDEGITIVVDAILLIFGRAGMPSRIGVVTVAIHFREAVAIIVIVGGALIDSIVAVVVDAIG
jgi:hypothetical protein